MSYTVKELNGCKVIKGSIPVLDLLALLKAWDDSWTVDQRLANAMKVSMVVGGDKELAAWRSDLKLDDES